MNYFKSNYNNVRLPIGSETEDGLRNAQIGAIHSIASFFTTDLYGPALVVMPTGSGKTAVLVLSGYTLRAKKILVISSSVMVRGQIYDEFITLDTLKKLNVFSETMEPPKVIEIKSPIKSIEEWKKLSECDVVIGIPNSINEGINETFYPPPDLFDLILVDEAHHVPAFTWSRIIKQFPNSKKIYFTATPFRRDRKEVDGQLIYNYQISKAYEDKIFGDIGYYPVNANGKEIDLVIAQETEKIFNIDKEAGFKHAIMVRTETKEQSEKLEKIYNENTKLKLRRVDSTLTYNTIKRTITKLKMGELDGIICVDMLGEGFDFPNLKIAAIHSPKKSLSATLQFIGRFARTNAEKIGEAKFLAEPSDIKIGKMKLYEEGAIWNDIIRDLSENVIEEENEIKHALDTFEKESIPQNKEEISYYNINPYCHIKVYKTDGINLNETLEISGHEIVFQAKSRELNSIIYITKESHKPKWFTSDEIMNINHYFFLLFYDTETKLMYVHSSIKTNQFYDMIMSKFSIGGYNRISKYQINKVLSDIGNTEFFNIGMQNRSMNSGETYRIITGPNAENTIRTSYSKNYANGHVFLKGVSEGENITIGYSTGSKVWSNDYQKIPNFIKWCQKIGNKIISDKEVKTNTGFDNLPIGVEVPNFPSAILEAAWDKETYQNSPFIIKINNGAEETRLQLLDFDIVIDQTNGNQVTLALFHNELCIDLIYDLQAGYKYVSSQDVEYVIEEDKNSFPLQEYLNDNPLTFYMANFATIVGREYFSPPNEKEYRYDPSNIQSYNWDFNNTDITVEFYEDPKYKVSNGNRASIHESLLIELRNQNYQVIIYDHGTGETADYITIKEGQEKNEINLYHIKGSTGKLTGKRVADLYEVCMQAVKSQVWSTNKKSFLKKIRHRVTDNPTKFIIGDLIQLESIINQSKKIEFNFVIVQPGISAQKLTPGLSYILAATDDTLNHNGYQPLIVIGS
jgi:superfamily II DNA or RNA helicase